VANIWRNKYSKISYFIEDLYINKESSSYKLEIDLVEFLIKTNDIHGISVNFNGLNSLTKKRFKSIKFEYDKNQLYYKAVEI
jgi:hypothetical protein